MRRSSGKGELTSAAEDKSTTVTVLRNRQLTPPQMRAHINASQSSCSRHISTSAVKRRLCTSGLHAWIAAKTPLLREANMERRVSWAKKQKNCRLPDKLKSELWSDVTRFEFFGFSCRVFVWCRWMDDISTLSVSTLKYEVGGVTLFTIHGLPHNLTCYCIDLTSSLLISNVEDLKKKEKTLS